MLSVPFRVRGCQTVKFNPIVIRSQYANQVNGAGSLVNKCVLPDQEDTLEGLLQHMLPGSDE